MPYLTYENWERTLTKPNSPPLSICFLPRKNPPSNVKERMNKQATILAMLVEGIAAATVILNVEATTLTKMTINIK